MQNYVLSTKQFKLQQKNHQEKVTCRKLKQCMSKSQKVHFYLFILLITFVKVFGDNLDRFDISIEFCVF